MGVIDEGGDLLFFEEEGEELGERSFFVDVEDGRMSVRQSESGVVRFWTKSSRTRM